MDENNLDYLKVDIKTDLTEFKRKEFMENLTKHPDLLEKFSIERLEIILQYYLKENEKKKMLLKNI